MLNSDMMRGFHDLLVLKVLEDHDSYGYQVSSTIFKWSGDRYRLKETTLYSCFNRLQKNGFIFSYDGQVTHGRGRIYYRITPNGSAFLKELKESYGLIKIIMDEFLEQPHEC